MQNIHYSVKPVVETLANQTAATVNGAAIDRIGFDDIELVVATGAASGTPTSYTVDCKLQGSDDGSTNWTDLSVATTQITADSTIKKAKVANAYLKNRYIRTVTVVAFVGGTTPAVPVLAQVLLGMAQNEPVA